METNSSTEITTPNPSPLYSSAENSADEKEQTVDQLLEKLFAFDVFDESEGGMSKHKEQQNVNIIEQLRKEFERKEIEKTCKKAVVNLFKDDQERS